MNSLPQGIMLVEIEEGKINIHKNKCWADRCGSMDRLLSTSDLDLTKNKKFFINTRDIPVSQGQFEFPVLAFCSMKGYFDIPIPFFGYDHWLECKIDTWEKEILKLKQLNSPAIHNKAIWIGSNLCKTRANARAFFKNHSDIVDFFFINWKEIRSNNDNEKYMQLSDLMKYKMLYDLPGVGFSARTHYLFFCQRPIIKFRDPFIMWFEKLISDKSIIYCDSFGEMMTETKKLLEDESYYNEIVNNTKLMADQFIDKKHAVKYLQEVINNI